jgi:hypothetical protein
LWRIDLGVFQLSSLLFDPGVHDRQCFLARFQVRLDLGKLSRGPLLQAFELILRLLHVGLQHANRVRLIEFF